MNERYAACGRWGWYQLIQARSSSALEIVGFVHSVGQNPHKGIYGSRTFSLAIVKPPLAALTFEKNTN